MYIDPFIKANALYTHVRVICDLNVSLENVRFMNVQDLKRCNISKIVRMFSGSENH